MEETKIVFKPMREKSSVIKHSRVFASSMEQNYKFSYAKGTPDGSSSILRKFVPVGEISQFSRKTDWIDLKFPILFGKS